MIDPISIAPLAISVWKLIEPYAKKLGGKLLEKAGESLPDAAGKVWDIVKEKMETKPETQSLPADLVKTPEDEDTQGAFKYQLKKLLENDEAFAKQLDELVRQAKVVTTYSAHLAGDGAIAQGENSTAVGKGGMYIGGNVSDSNVVIGDNNAVNTGKRGTEKK